MAKAAIGQICASNSMTHNLAQCVRLVGQAASAGAKILFLPEASDYISTTPQEALSLAHPVSSSPFVTGLQAAAAQHAIAVHVGIHVPVSVKPVSTVSNPVLPSLPAPEDGISPTTTSTESVKLYNRTIYISPTGTIDPNTSYNKLHLFDYSTLRESASTQAGADLIAPFPSPVGRLGSLICFDMRFSEPAIHLTQGRFHGSPISTTTSTTPTINAGNEPAQILLYPSAFTVPTGRAHWEILLRARAIETQSYVIAAAQVGPHNEISPADAARGKKPRVSYGHSMVVDPWGRVMLKMKGVREDWDGEDVKDAVEEGAIGELGVVDIDLGEWERVREGMPLIRRTDVYPQI